MKLSQELGVVWIELAVLSDDVLIGRIDLFLERLWHRDFECPSIRRGNPFTLVFVDGGSALIE